MSAPRVAIVGAGVAGLAAAHALARGGCELRLFERRAEPGGRASSYLHPALGEVIDSQHVLLGCCTALLYLLSSTGTARHIRWYPEQTFLEPGGRATRLRQSRLPAPFHFAPSLLRARMLSAADKVSIARGLLEFADGSEGRDEESAAGWFLRRGQTPGAIRHFFEPLLYATMNDAPARCSMKYAAKVFYEICIKTSGGGLLGIPRIPLGELFGEVAAAVLAGGDSAAGRYAGGKAAGEAGREKGSDGGLDPGSGPGLLCRQAVRRLEEREGGWRIHTETDEHFADAVVLAVPAREAAALLAALAPEGGESLAGVGQVEDSPYTTVHLWFDRPVTELDHGWMLDGTMQFFFNKTGIRGLDASRGQYLELAAGGLPALLCTPRQQILELALAELAAILPGAGKAGLRKWGILKDARATFAAAPGFDALRVGQRSPWRRLYVAGDWTRTGWPSTMESAARSGYLAAGELGRDLGLAVGQPPADPPPDGLMRFYPRARG
jgi:zeta-carotene desaturase